MRDMYRPVVLNSVVFVMVSENIYRAFGGQANQLILNIPVLKGLLRVNSTKEHLQSSQIENNELQILKYQMRKSKEW